MKAVKSRLAAAAERAELLESEVASRAAGCGAAERRSAACAKKEGGGAGGIWAHAASAGTGTGPEWSGMRREGSVKAP